jgi:hypothetical protein
MGLFLGLHTNSHGEPFDFGSTPGFATTIQVDHPPYSTNNNNEIATTTTAAYTGVLRTARNGIRLGVAYFVIFILATYMTTFGIHHYER